MKDKIYRFAYTGLFSFWTNKDMKKFFERKRSTRFKSFKKRKPKMKKLLSLPVVVLFMIGCKNYSFKSEKEMHREKFHAYSDSFDKYMNIHTQCGSELMDYYYKKQADEYLLTYPKGNPISIENKKVFDTLCYPIKNNQP